MTRLPSIFTIYTRIFSLLHRRAATREQRGKLEPKYTSSVAETCSSKGAISFVYCTSRC